MKYKKYVQIALKRIEKTKDKINTSFSEGLKNFMERKNISTKELAEMLGITDSAISSWKYERAMPDSQNLIKLFILGLSPFEIIDPTLQGFAINSHNENYLTTVTNLYELIKNNPIDNETTSILLDHYDTEKANLSREIEKFYKSIEEK